MQNYEKVKNIGSGSFGQVYLVNHKKEKKQYVVKRISLKGLKPKDKSNIKNEIELMKKLNHPNIVEYKESFIGSNYISIIMSYCEGGDLHNKIQEKQGEHFSESIVLDWFAQMVLSLHYLHERKILHRDLKTQNIFIQNGRLVFGDFGIAKTLNSTKDFANTCIGTPYYMSPELFKYKPYSYKSDIWALGCVFYEITNLKTAFTADSLSSLARRILKGQFLPIKNGYSTEINEIIVSMLNTNPKKRPSITELIEKPIIKKRVVCYMIDLLSAYPRIINFRAIEEQKERLRLAQLVDKYKERFIERKSEKIKAVLKEKEVELKRDEEVRNSIEKRIEDIEKLMRKKLLDEQDEGKPGTTKKSQFGLISTIKEESESDDTLFSSSENESEEEQGEEEVTPELKRDTFIEKNENILTQFGKNEDYEENEEFPEEVPPLQKKLSKKLKKYKKDLERKTNNIKDLKSQIERSSIFEEKGGYFDLDTDFSMSDIDEDDLMNEKSKPEEAKPDIEVVNPLNEGLLKKIKKLQNQCVECMGQAIFDQAYEYLKQEAHTREPSDPRIFFCDLFGESRIGFWHLIEQILMYESLMV